MRLRLFAAPFLAFVTLGLAAFTHAGCGGSGDTEASGSAGGDPGAGGAGTGGDSSSTNSGGAMGTGGSPTTGSGGSDPGIISTSPLSDIEAETHVATGTNGFVIVAWIAIKMGGGSSNGYVFSQDDGKTFTPVDEVRSPNAGA